VGLIVGEDVGWMDGFVEGAVEGDRVGEAEGWELEGIFEGDVETEGLVDITLVGWDDGFNVTLAEGFVVIVGINDGMSVGR